MITQRKNQNVTEAILVYVFHIKIEFGVEGGARSGRYIGHTAC